MSNETENSASQAAAQLASIKEMVAALVAANEAEDDNAREEVETAIHQDALSVEVKNDWYAVGNKPEAPTHFRILLCTGGPAVQIVGCLSEHSEPELEGIELQHQDWGTPWTNLRLTEEDRKVLLAYATCFYFGE